MSRSLRCLTLTSAGLLLTLAAPAFAEMSRMLPDHDRRQDPPRTTNTAVPAPSFGDRATWERRRTELREQVANAAGLLPMPERTPLNARISGRIERDGYSVEKVAIETMPGLVLGGNLYRPLGRPGLFPAVLNPHGHWEHGRLENIERGSIPGRCINFARQGYVAFAYDMLGYNDTGLGLDHRKFAQSDPAAALWGIGPFGVQTWNSLRALDFLLSLADVDPERIAVTGASGGGTQTFILLALDDRPDVAAPVNMISLTMQGGCDCENAPGLRIDTDNVELGAMTAPRPMLMVAATGDWTVKTPTVEGPAERAAWALYGAADRLQWQQFEAEHNYNKASRQAVYRFFGQWVLHDEHAGHLAEQPFTVEDDAHLRVFPDGTPPPEQWDEARLIARLKTDRLAQFEAALPHDAASLAAFRANFGAALRHSLAVSLPAPSEVLGEAQGERLVLGRAGRGDRVEAHWHGAEGDREAALVAGEGPAAAEATAALRKAGRAVLELPPFRFAEPRDVHQEFFTGYNHTELANRVQDVLTAIAWLRQRGYAHPALVGVGPAGYWALLARAFAGELGPTACDLNGLDTATDAAFTGELWQPGLRRAGDFRTAAILAAPGTLLLHGAGRFGQAPVARAYGVAGGKLQVAKESWAPGAAASWVVDAATGAPAR